MSVCKTYAYDFTVDGIYYNILSLSDLTATVTNNETDYYTGKITIPDSIVYKNKIFKIASIDQAFKGCTTLKEVIIGRNINNITANAFNGCVSLTSIKIPNSVLNIFDGAFTGCTSLKNIIFEDGSTKLSLGCKSYRNSYGYGLFYDCPLDSVYLGRDITFKANASYGYSPFYFKSISYLSIGDSVSEIYPLSFWRCKNINKLKIPRNIKKIGNYAFAECSHLKEIEYSATECSDFIVTNISNNYPFNDYPFNGTPLKDVNISEGIKKIPSYFMYNQANVKQINIPSSISEIGNYAFTYCDSLVNISVNKNNNKFLSDDGVLYNISNNKLLQYPKAKVGTYNIPINIDSIGDYAFYDCNKLTAVTLPNSILYIGNYAFYSCDTLQSITIPKFVTDIGFSSFANCHNLKKIIYNAQNCNDFKQDFDTKKYPFDGSPISELIFENDADYTPGYFMNNQTHITKLNFNNVTRIGWRAFVGCCGLKEIIFGKNNSAIAYSAFIGCDSIKTIYAYNTTPPIGKLYLDDSSTTVNFDDAVYINATLFIPTNCLNIYKKDDGWNKFLNIEEFNTSDVKDHLNNNIKISLNNRYICINGIGENCIISIYNANGIELYNGVSRQISVLNSGYYFIKVESEVYKIYVQ